MNCLTPNWPAPPQVKAYTTLRNSWGHPGHQAKDEQASHALKTLLSLPSDPIWLDQTHSSIAIPAIPQSREPIADASFTHEPNRVCVVLTADCLPLLICDKQGTHVAAIHAGWRGLASGIIEATLKALQLPVNETLVWLGPAIGPEKFEVGRDVFEAFTKQDEAAKIAFHPLPTKDKWLADLYTLARLRLSAWGISEIYGGEFCTHTQTDLFYSYRRDGKTGRMASTIWIAK